MACLASVPDRQDRQSTQINVKNLNSISIKGTVGLLKVCSGKKRDFSPQCSGFGDKAKLLPVIHSFTGQAAFADTKLMRKMQYKEESDKK